MDLGEFFLNDSADSKEAAVVEAPAFSLTKVMSVVAPLITAVVALLTTLTTKVTFSSGEVVTLIVALIAFLAITASADVLARGIATSAAKSASGRLRMVQFTKPLPAMLSLSGPDEKVSVVAASDASPPEYLCVRADSSVTWEPASTITF
jgi:hypothetical protein